MRELQLVEAKGEIVLTTSLLVAEKFSKSHKFVLRKIDELKCSSEFIGANFTPIFYLDSYGREQKSYLLTEEGFMFIAMRFTGKEAVEWQEKFVGSFQSMRKELNRIREQRLTIDWQESRANGKCIRNVLTDSVKALERIADKQGGVKLDRNGNPKPESRHYYESTTKMIYKQLFGDGTLKEVRDKLDSLQLQFLSICEQACADEIGRLVDLGLDYHDIYAESKKRVIATVQGLSASKLTSPGAAVRLAWDKTRDTK